MKIRLANRAAVRSIASLAALVLAIGASAASPHRPEAGDVAPKQLGIDREAHPVSLDDYAGKVVVVSFWASWCGPCLKELPILDGIQKTAGTRQLQVIAINIESPDVYRQIAKRLASFDLLVVHDWGKTASDAYGVHGIPHMLIIGRDGRIVRVHRGYDERALDGIVDEINGALLAR